MSERTERHVEQIQHHLDALRARCILAEDDRDTYAHIVLRARNLADAVRGMLQPQTHWAFDPTHAERALTEFDKAFAELSAGEGEGQP